MTMTNNELQRIILDCLKGFYTQRKQKLSDLKLRQVLRRKNPYLYKALGNQNATEIIEEILKAYLSSSDETIFGNEFFEPVAKAISGGVVAPSEGVDIAIETRNKYIAIAVKSGPNQYNSSQKKRQNDEFQTLRSRLMKIKKQFDAILGHGYGKLSTEPSKTRIYRDLSGQRFWHELTGDKGFYIKLIKLMKDKIILKHREEYKRAWEQAVNRYVREFTNDFCDKNGAINWEKLLKFNSGET